MIRIEYPPFDYRIRTEAGKEWIFDELRRQWVRLTPEEWVRQNTLQYLVQVMRYPPSLIAVEKEILLGEMRKRFDILVYRDARPWMMIECKEMNVPMDEPALKQILNYNIVLQASYLLITNGSFMYGFGTEKGKMQQIHELPPFL